MSSLSCGIVGLPNVGKSTFFNALLKRQIAYAANFPFATIEPNIGVVPVPDKRLTKLAEVVKESEHLNHLPPEVPATVEFVDIAGLIAGAHKGEGLGNKFLSHIRQTDAICHVVRVFTSEEIIKEGSVDPASDFATIEMELMMADMETIDKQKEPKGAVTNEDKIRWQAVLKIREAFEKEIPVREIEFSNEEKKEVKSLGLLSAKPILVALNCDEEDLKNATSLEIKYAKEFGVHTHQVIAISAKLEEQLSSLSDSDASEYLSGFGLQESGLERIIKKAFETLGLITFLTAGEKEVRAWTVRLGSTSLTAAGQIHTDFEKHFIKADVVEYGDFIDPPAGGGGWQACREKGKVRSEGKEYVVCDGDVIEFKVGS